MENEKLLEAITAKLEAMIILAKDTELDDLQQEELMYLIAAKHYFVNKLNSTYAKEASDEDFADLIIEEE